MESGRYAFKLVFLFLIWIKFQLIDLLEIVMKMASEWEVMEL